MMDIFMYVRVSAFRSQTQKAIAQAEEYGLLGDNILGSA